MDKGPPGLAALFHSATRFRLITAFLSRAGPLDGSDDSAGTEKNCRDKNHHYAKEFVDGSVRVDPGSHP